MTITPAGTNIHEIADGIYRINTPVPPSEVPGGFSFNQYLIVDHTPLLFHTGLRRLFPSVSEAVARVERKAWVGAHGAPGLFEGLFWPSPLLRGYPPTIGVQPPDGSHVLLFLHTGLWARFHSRLHPTKRVNVVPVKCPRV
jgi:hypothetical protein